MSIIPTIVLLFPYTPLSVSPTDDLRLEIGRHRRDTYAHSTDAEDPS
jgi:hypothetical protein